MFDQFPKVRPALSPEIAAIYGEHYASNRRGDTPASRVSQSVEAWMHRRVAQDVLADPDTPRSTLEIGAGTLNQLGYEPDVGPYDVVEPFAALYSESLSAARVRHAWSDIGEVPPDNRYDRITSVAAFEHICNLPEVVARSALLLAANGELRAAIPSEGTALWALGWRLTTGLEFRYRHGLDYGELMRHEHVNTAEEIEAILQHFFDRVTTSAFGVSKNWSIYQFLACAAPVIPRCEEYLANV